MNPQDIINNFKTNNPSYQTDTPTSGGSNWLSNVQQGAYLPKTNQESTAPDKSVGFAGTKFLGERLGVLSEMGPLLESQKNADYVRKNAEKSLASGKITQERFNQETKGINPDIYSAIPKMTSGEITRGGIKAGLDIGSLFIGGGGVEGIGKATLGGLVKQGAVQGLKSGATSGAMSGLGQGIEQNQGVGNTVGQTVKGGAIGGAIGGVVGGMAPTISKLAGKVTGESKPTQQILEESAIKDTTPNYNKNLIGEPHVQNIDKSIVPRVSEAKGVNMRTVNPRPSEISAGQELSKVEGYNPKATNLDKYNLVNNEISKRGKSLESSLKNEGVLRPPQEIMKTVKDAVNTAAQDSLVIQKTDPAVKNYLRVASRAIKQSPGTLEGELKVRKALDTAYENAGGKFGNNKGLDQIHRAARNAINNDLENAAQSTQVKAALKEQSNLYRASDILKDKARAEGGSKFEQFAKNHPIAMKITKPIARVAGIGAGVHIIP